MQKTIKAKIVWFFGPSCAGKATTIDRITNNYQELYPEILDLETQQKIEKCEESFIKSEPRKTVISAILNKYNYLDIDVLLVKGQTKDLDEGISQSLREQLSNVTHEIVFLWVDPEELNRRRLETRKTSYWKGWGIGNHIEELNSQVQKVHKLAEINFPVFWVDNTGSIPEIITYDQVKLRTARLNKNS